MRISAFGPSSSPFNSLVILLIHLAFPLCLFGWCHIFFKNCFVSFASSCWYVFVSSSTSCWKNFLSLFWNIRFCLYNLTLCRYLFNLPSFASTFWFTSSSYTVIFSRFALFFLFQYIPASFFCFIILASFRRFFYLRFHSNFPSRFWFFLRAFWGDPNFLTN